MPVISSLRSAWYFGGIAFGGSGTGAGAGAAALACAGVDVAATGFPHNGQKLESSGWVEPQNRQNIKRRSSVSCRWKFVERIPFGSIREAGILSTLLVRKLVKYSATSPKRMDSLIHPKPTAQVEQSKYGNKIGT